MRFIGRSFGAAFLATAFLADFALLATLRLAPALLAALRFGAALRADLRFDEARFANLRFGAALLAPLRFTVLFFIFFSFFFLGKIFSTLVSYKKNNFNSNSFFVKSRNSGLSVKI
jgi:hypothetical protein